MSQHRVQHRGGAHQTARHPAHLDEAPAVDIEEHRQSHDEPDIAGAEQEDARRGKEVDRIIGS